MWIRNAFFWRNSGKGVFYSRLNSVSPCVPLWRGAQGEDVAGSILQIEPPSGSGLQPEPLNLLNASVCAIDKILKGINTWVQVANLNPRK